MYKSLARDFIASVFAMLIALVSMNAAGFIITYLSASSLSGFWVVCIGVLVTSAFSVYSRPFAHWAQNKFYQTDSWADTKPVLKLIRGLTCLVGMVAGGVLYGFFASFFL